LIPPYAIGVFTGFTLAQAGMVRHWLGGRPNGWWWRVTINGLGGVATGIATLIFVLTKFRDGGGMVVFAVPLLIWLFIRVSAY
jgi:hypothetical protein